MKVRLLVVLAVLVAALGAISSAQAIIRGQPDAGRHPYVGGLVTVLDGEYFLICTGTMISPDVFLTAGHCTSFLEENDLPAFVTFDEAFDYQDPEGPLYAGELATHPGYVEAAWPYTPDLGVVVLDDEPGLGYATLPELGLIDEIRDRPAWRKTQITNVGYGGAGYVRGGGPPQRIYPDLKLTATSYLRLGPKPWALDENYVFKTNHPGGTNGGTCSGDSGGPYFLGGFSSDLLIGVHSGGNNVGFQGVICGVGPKSFAFRLDTALAREFLDDYVRVP